MAGQVLQVVSGDGAFNGAGVGEFVKETGVEGAGQGYTVVAIMGPQSSGKSTLLNHLVRSRRGCPPPLAALRAAAPPAACLPLGMARPRATLSAPCCVATTPPQFGTRFEEMDALSGRSQTTRGIWLAKATKARRRCGGQDWPSGRGRPSAARLPRWPQRAAVEHSATASPLGPRLPHCVAHRLCLRFVCRPRPWSAPAVTLLPIALPIRLVHGRRWTSRPRW